MNIQSTQRLDHSVLFTKHLRMYFGSILSIIIPGGEPTTLSRNSRSLVLGNCPNFPSLGSTLYIIISPSPTQELAAVVEHGPKILSTPKSSSLPVPAPSSSPVAQVEKAGECRLILNLQESTRETGCFTIFRRQGQNS